MTGSTCRTEMAGGKCPGLSVVLCLHREGALLLPALQSLTEAIRFAQAEGMVPELVGVLDRADGDTAALFRGWAAGAPCPVQVIETGHGSLGLARNAGGAAARGDWLCFADGDDLVSWTMLAGLFAAAVRAGPRTVVMPEWLLTFGAQDGVNLVVPLRQIGPLNLLGSNPFVSRICLHRSALAAIPFRSVRPQEGYAYEDWHHHCALVAAGYDLVTAPLTALFYRLHDGGLRAMSETRSSGIIPPSPLFDAAVFRRVCAADRAALAAAGGGVAFAYPAILGNGPVAELVRAAGRIDPAIGWERYAGQGVQTPLSPAHKHAGAVYFDICAVLAARAIRRVWVTDGAGARGADAETLTLAFVVNEQAMPRLDAAAGRLTVTAPRDLGERLLAKIVQSLIPPETPLHIRQDAFGMPFLARIGGTPDLATRWDVL